MHVTCQAILLAVPQAEGLENLSHFVDVLKSVDP